MDRFSSCSGPSRLRARHKENATCKRCVLLLQTMLRGGVFRSNPLLCCFSSHSLHIRASQVILIESYSFDYLVFQVPTWTHHEDLWGMTVLWSALGLRLPTDCGVCTHVPKKDVAGDDEGCLPRYHAVGGSQGVNHANREDRLYWHKNSTFLLHRGRMHTPSPSSSN